MMSDQSRLYLLPILLIVSILLAACGSSTTSSPSEVSFSRDVQNIFNVNCVVCHQGTSASENLNLEAGVSYQNLVDIESTQSPLSLVSPGNNEESYLWHKLNGTQGNVGGGGLQMPYNLSPLQQDDLELVKQWINEGAQNN